MSNEAALREIGAKEKTHRIIYLCEPTKLPELHRLIVEEVVLSKDPAVGDIYNHTLSKKWCLHHQGKLKLALAAAIEWDTVETRPVLLQRDYIHYQAVGSIRREFGRVIKFRGDYEFDLISLREDLIAQYSEKADKDNKSGAEKERYVKYCVQRDFAQKRQHRLKLAATGAKSVVIDKLLNLKAGYKNPEEAAGPYLIVRCQVAPDLSNPVIRNQLSIMALQAAAGIFGAPPAPQIGIDPDAIDVGGDEPPIDIPPPGEPPPDAPPQNMSFEEMDEQTQRDVLHDLAKRKRYDTSTLRYPVDSLNAANRIAFYNKLMSMEG
jgi:hypothetical protein